MPRTQQTWRQEFLGWRSSTVERPSTRASAARTSFWQLKRLVTLSTYRRYTNDCIYLSIYCSTQRVGHTSSSKLKLTREVKQPAKICFQSFVGFVFCILNLPESDADLSHNHSLDKLKTQNSVQTLKAYTRCLTAYFSVYICLLMHYYITQYLSHR